MLNRVEPAMLNRYGPPSLHGVRILLACGGLELSSVLFELGGNARFELDLLTFLSFLGFLASSPLELFSPSARSRDW